MRRKFGIDTCCAEEVDGDHSLVYQSIPFIYRESWINCSKAVVEMGFKSPNGTFSSIDSVLSFIHVCFNAQCIATIYWSNQNCVAIIVIQNKYVFGAYLINVY